MASFVDQKTDTDFPLTSVTSFIRSKINKSMELYYYRLKKLPNQ